jgi:hypothetical protein
MRIIPILGFFALLLFVPVSSADLLKPQPYALEQKIPIMISRSHRLQFKPNESALVQAYGSGSSTLLLYVFDASGNCVAWDDNVTDPQYCDEVGTEWIANNDGRYNVEIRNVGIFCSIDSPNGPVLGIHKYSMAVR